MAAGKLTLALSALILSIAITYVLSLPYSCKKSTGVGYFENTAVNPYNSTEGWYTYCYTSNGRWFAYPVRCPPDDVSTDPPTYLVYNATLKKCTEAVLEEAEE